MTEETRTFSGNSKDGAELLPHSASFFGRAAWGGGTGSETVVSGRPGALQFNPLRGCRVKICPKGHIFPPLLFQFPLSRSEPTPLIMRQILGALLLVALVAHSVHADCTGKTSAESYVGDVSLTDYGASRSRIVFTAFVLAFLLIKFAISGTH